MQAYLHTQYATKHFMGEGGLGGKDKRAIYKSLKGWGTLHGSVYGFDCRSKLDEWYL